MIVLTPGNYALTILLVALMGAGTAVTAIRYRKAKAASDLIRLIASPLAVAGFATMFTSRWHGFPLVLYSLIFVVSDVLHGQREGRWKSSSLKEI